MHNSNDLEHELKKSTRGEVRFDAYSRILYSTDASIYQIEPLGVVIPRGIEDVLAVMEISRRHQVPVLPRGAGTSLAGQAIGQAIVMDFSKYMNRVHEVNAEARSVRVEPGVVLDELNKQLRPTGLFFPPDPATASRCNIGGMIGNNACGSRSIVYGRTSDYLNKLNVTLASGERITVRPLSKDELLNKVHGDSHESRVYRELVRLTQENKDEIERRFPKILRREGGYNLDSLHSADGFHLERLLAGSEGTLAVVLEAELRLVERPKATVVMVAHFREIMEALEATQVVLETGPSAVELLDKMILDLTRSSPSYSNSMTFVEGDPAALLVIEFAGEGSEELKSRMDEAEKRLRRAGLGFAFLRETAEEAQANVWKVRKAGQGLLLGMPGERKYTTIVEDTAVAPEKLPAYIKRFREIIRDHDTEAAYYAHASAGCLHIRPLINLKKSEDIAKLKSIAEAVSDLVLEFGGALSGEHGDGYLRSPFNRKMFGTKLYEVFREVKRVFDPKRLLNPGKIVDSPAMTDNLRLQQTNDSLILIQPGKKPLQSVFDHSRQEGLIGAIEMCSGVGACRKRGEGTMCPSYMVTGEEEHSTRGRAVLLQAAISGRLPHSELASDRMFEAMDLCLECKGCKGECPANVDMAKLKTEFLAQYYQQHMPPMRSFLFGEIAKVNEAASMLPFFLNFVARNQLARWIMEKAWGIDRRRALPLMAKERFSQWFDKRKIAADEALPAVGLFVDTFTEFNYPEVGQAAVRVLEAAGYRVERLQTQCCGRPLLSKGLVSRAIENAQANISILSRAVSKGLPIVGLEPSCLLTFRDEYPALLPGPQTQRIADNSLLLEEFLDPARLQIGAVAPLGSLPRKALFHGHCHLKALVGSGPSMRLLASVSKLQVEEVDSGCCGMAGSFGFEKEHYEMSIALAERRLAPAVRALDRDALVVASGVSCRQQILHTTGRMPLHPAEVLALALNTK